MPGVGAAWGAGLALIFWREFAVYHEPPPAGRLLAATGAFAVLSLVALYEPAKTAATLAAWGLDLMVLLTPGVLPGTATPGQRQSTGTTQAPGTSTAGGRG